MDAHFLIQSSDNLTLAGYHWPVKDTAPPIASIILIHGFAEHCRRYERFVDFYNDNQFAVVSMDLRGHGQSDGRHAYIPNTESVLDDIDKLVKKAKELYPSIPSILYGHSMGGTLALTFTLEKYSQDFSACPYKALIVTSPWIRLARRLQPPRPVYSLVRSVSRFKPSMPIRLRFNPNKITRDEEVIDSYVNDDDVRREATLSLAATMGNLAVRLDRTRHTFDMPVLIEHGAADLITNHDASEKFAQRTKADFKSWPDCYHELHSEPEREEIFKYTLEWIHQKLFFAVF